MLGNSTIQGGGELVAFSRWVRMRGGGSHTSQGDCELISTLEGEEGVAGWKVRKKERSKAERDEERTSGKSWVLELSYKTRRGKETGR